MGSLEHLLTSFVELLGLLLDLTGVLIITAGVFRALPAYTRAVATTHGGAAENRKEAFHQLRTRVGMTVLLGLEVLVAADIVKTMAVEPTLESVAVLGLLVLVRTFLSWTLTVDIEGRWPWQQVRTPKPPSDGER
jgi:uncharacterized membrane protein